MLSLEKLTDPIIGLAVSSAVLWLIQKIRKKAKRMALLPADEQTYTLAPEDLQRINQRYQGQVIANGPYFHEPQIEETGPWQLDAEQQASSENYRQHFRQNNIPNDPHAAVAHAMTVHDDPVALQVLTLDYGALKALRERLPQTDWPKVLSASVLIIDPVGEKLILHRRSAKSATYPNYLHTIGGAYWPAMDGRDGDRQSIRNTAIRETLEEINTPVVIKKQTPLCLLEEVQTGFVQFIYLGCTVYDTDYLKSNAEGKFTTVAFNKIAETLKKQNNMVPTGEAAILLWLAMGAPGTEQGTRLGSYKPRQLFLEVCRQRRL